MGTTEQMVQAAGPRLPGGGVVETRVRELGEQTVPMVRVVWSTTRQHEAQVPVSLWERLSGAPGPTGDGPVDQYLSDLETSREYADMVVIYRDVDSVTDSETGADQ